MAQGTVDFIDAIGQPEPARAFSKGSHSYVDDRGRQYREFGGATLNAQEANRRYNGIALTVYLPPKVRHADPDLRFPDPENEVVTLYYAKSKTMWYVGRVRAMYYLKETSATGVVMIS